MNRFLLLVFLSLLSATLSQNYTRPFNTRVVRTIGNFVFSLTQRNLTLNFFFKARSRFGYFYVGFSNSAVELTGGLVLMMSVDYKNGFDGYRNITYWRYVGGNSTKLEPNLYQNTSYFILDHYKVDLNYFPLGRYNNDINYIVDLKRSDFPWINEETWIHAGFSYNNVPNGPLEFASPDETRSIQVKDINDDDQQYFPPIARLENLHISLFILELIALMVLFIVCLLLYIFKKQPISSRGLTPMLACFGHFVHIFSGITQYVYTLEDFKYNCIWLYFLQQSVLLTLLFLTFVHFFRYTIILSLNREKSKIKINEPRERWKQIRFKILKILGTNYFLLASVIIFYFLNTVIYLIGFSSTKFICDRRSSWPYALYIVSVSLFCVFFILLFLFEVYMNFNKIKSCRFIEIWANDIYSYRLEIYGLGLFIVFPFWLISLFMNPDFFMITSFRFDRNQIRPEIPIVSSLDSVSFYTFFFMQCGFPLVITLSKLIFCFHKPQKTIFAEFLENEQKKKIFAVYCKHEWSYENIACFDDIKKYEKEKDLEERKQMALKLVDLYFKPSSELEVNVPKQYIADINEKISKDDFSNNLFEKALNSVYENLSDTYSRFVITPLYERIIEKELLLKNVSIRKIAK